MDNTIDKDALMNFIFLGQGLPIQTVDHPSGDVVALMQPDQLVDFHSNELGRQPYQVREDADFVKLVESVMQRGIFEPIIVRPDAREKGKYEIISGHRRRLAALRAGVANVPILIQQMDDDEANIRVCDGNLHREDIKTSEKAWTYRIKLGAMNRQGKRTDLTSAQLEQKLNRTTSVEIMAQELEESRAQIQRYIRLTYLLPELLNMVDEGQLKFMIGVELSYLKQPEQEALLDVITCDRVKPSLEQAQQLKQMSKEKRTLTVDLIHVLLQKESGSTGLTAGYINKLLPQDIRKLPTVRKKAYTQAALEYYAEYLKEHPEKQQEWKK